MRIDITKQGAVGDGSGLEQNCLHGYPERGRSVSVEYTAFRHPSGRTGGGFDRRMHSVEAGGLYRAELTVFMRHFSDTENHQDDPQIRIFILVDRATAEQCLATLKIS